MRNIYNRHYFGWISKYLVLSCCWWVAICVIGCADSSHCTPTVARTNERPIVNNVAKDTGESEQLPMKRRESEIVRRARADVARLDRELDRYKRLVDDAKKELENAKELREAMWSEFQSKAAIYHALPLDAGREDRDVALDEMNDAQRQQEEASRLVEEFADRVRRIYKVMISTIGELEKADARLNEAVLLEIKSDGIKAANNDK